MQEVLRVPQVSCGHCKSAIEAAVRPLEGVTAAEVDVTGRTVAVSFDPGSVTRESIVRAIEESGYSVG